MKHLTFKILFITLLAALSLQVFALPPTKEKAKFYLVKTNRMLGVAHMTVKRTKNFTGDLAKATKHERVAVKAFQAGEFEKAIFHSKRARVLCIKIFNDNKIKPPMDAKYTAEEEQLAAGSPSEEELDKAVAAEELKDQDLMEGNLGVDAFGGAY